MTKVVFLDFDGPLLPEKANLPRHSNGCERMDPYAVLFVNRLLEDSDVKIVISSSHSHSGREHCDKLLMTNGIDISAIHEDWRTPYKMSSDRTQEIAWWLENHPEVTTYVAIDDLTLSPDFVKYSVRCDSFNGLTYANFLECRYFLDILYQGESKEGLLGRIHYHKKREVWNVTKQCHNKHVIDEILDDNFPRIVPKKEEDESI